MKKTFFLLITILLAQSTLAQEWKSIGNSGFSSSSAYYTSLSIDSNNTLYIAYSDVSKGYKTTVMKFNGTNWEVVGSAGFSDGTAYSQSLAIGSNDTPYVAYKDVENSNKTTVMKFNGTNWEVVGNVGFSTGSATYISLAIDNNNIPYVAYKDVVNSNKTTVMKFNGTNWEVVGNVGFSAGNTNYQSLAIDNNNIPYVAYQDYYGYQYKSTVMKFNGTNWEVVGTNGFSDGEAEYQSLTFNNNNTPYVAYKDKANSNKSTVMKFNGTNWEVVGNTGFSDGEADYQSLAIDNDDIPYVAYKDIANSNKTTIMKFDGSNWEIVGNAGFSDGEADYQSLVIDSNNIPYVAYQDDAINNKSTVMKVSYSPNITTNNPIIILNTSATLGGNATSDNGYSITERGIVYSSSDTSPRIGENEVSKNAIGTGEGTFSKNIIGLSQNTLYYYNTYAINSQGTSYGEVKSFTTYQDKPSLQINPTALTYSTTAMLTGKVLHTGSDELTEHGFVYSTTNYDPTIDGYNTTKVISNGNSTGRFSYKITGLTNATNYYFKAYATNSYGTTYSNFDRFTTANNSLDFNGTDDHVNISDDTSFDFSNGFTMEAWVNPNSLLNSQTFFSQYSTNQKAFSIILKSNGTIEYTISIDGIAETYFTTDTAITANTWSHIAFTYNGNTMKAYVNGIEDDNNMSITGTLFNSNNIIELGSRNYNHYYNGKMDEVRIWNKALTQTEVDTQKNQQIPTDSRGLIAYYNFNQGTANGNNSGIAYLFDATANNLKGDIRTFDLTDNSSNFVAGANTPFNNNSILENTFTTTGNWSDTNNWSLGYIPEQIDRVIINEGKTVTIDTEDLTIDDFTLETGATLSIPKDKEITIQNSFTSNGTLELSSDKNNSGVLLVKGTSTGTITYKRGGLLANKWSIITPPVAGQKIKAFADDVNNDIRTSGNKYAIGYYDDSMPDGQKWVYYTTSVDVNLEFEAGKSYAISRATDGEVSFTGTLAVNTTNKTVVANQWNAIGNPFTTYFPANKNGSSSFLNDNLSALDNTYKSIYMWDNTQNKYVAVTEVDANNRSLPPGQGFFVRLKTGQTQVTFNEEKRQTQPSSDNSVFAKSSNPSIRLAIDNGKHQVTTHIKYFNNASLGLDPGYDIGNFNGAELDVFTRLVNPVNNTNFTIQSLPKEHYENTVIPVGITAKAGETVTFSATAKNLPDNLQLYLEDKNNNSFTQLDKTAANYKITLSKNTNNTGRFYLHTTAGKPLAVDEIANKTLHIFVSKNRLLKITGNNNKPFHIQLIDILGRTVFTTKNKSEVQIPKQIKTGVYIVKVQKEKDQLIKKIRIE